MPTGYTTMLDDDPNLSTAQWIKEGLTRAFGVCVTLRDDNMDLSEEEIQKRLERNINSSAKYYIENLEKTKKLIKEMETNPDTFFSRAYAEYVETTDKYNKKSIEEAKQNTLRHNKAMIELQKVKENTIDEVTKNIANFGLEQLELVKSEREPHVTRIKTFLEFKADKIASLKRDVEYYKKNLDETIDRETDRVNTYKTIVAEVNRILEL